MKKLFALAAGCLLSIGCLAQTYTLIKEENGGIGINLGALSPTATLDVGGNIYARGGLYAESNNGDIGGHLDLINTGKTALGASKRWSIYNMGGAYGNSLQFWAYDTNECNGGQLCTPRLVILDNGNVGIGATQPQARLTVAGGISCNKIKVSSTFAWPDYVFESAYKLPSLQELELYIKTHKHLPDVPTAAEVEENGLDLGENQAVLLKKIEELTLYIIEMKKEMEEMKKKIN